MGGLTKALDPFTKAGDKLFGKMDPLGTALDPGFQERKNKRKEEEAVRRQQEQAEAAQRMADTLRRNLKADLDIENVANVVAGGSAELVDAAMSPKRKRTASPSLASNLGIRE